MKKGEIVRLPDPCPKCGKKDGDHKVGKSWIIEGYGKKGSGKKQRTRIETFQCLTCRRKWRRGVNLND